MAENREDGWLYADHATVLERRKKYRRVAVQVLVSGTTFASISECARANKVASSTVRKRIASRYFPGWTLVVQEPAKRPLCMGHMGVRPVIVEGQEFVSIQAAADYYCIHRHTVYNRCKSNNSKYKDWKLLPKKKP